jgi:acyl-CoA reductase-like NAD-dependent aldehyde dehydrogenase
MKAESFVHDRYTLYRAENGKRLPFESLDYREILSPWNRERISVVGYMNEAQAFENLDTAERAHRFMHRPKTHERIAILKRAAQILRDREEVFADLIAWEGGKPLKDARMEVARALVSLDWAAAEAGRIAGHEIPMRATAAASGRIAFTYPEPIGVVYAISAFNHPLNLIVHQVAPAIAVGCPVLVKPASETPLSCLHFLDCLFEAGLPPEMCLPLVCDDVVAEKIAKSKLISFLSFIGSAKVGWHLRSILAPGVRFSLEHGGSAPVLIDHGADLDRAIPSVLRGAYYHSGQVCVSTQRLFVHDSILFEFEKRFVEQIKRLKIGDPRDPATDCGPLIRSRDLRRVEERVRTAVSTGATLLIGGNRVADVAFEPTLLRDVQRTDAIVREEIFGPVAVLEGFRDLESAIDAANGVEWSFQAGFFGGDLDRALCAARGLRASAVFINDASTFRVDWMPFRGDGPSGFGTGGIPYSMKDMITEKMVAFHSNYFTM